jgi:hypothetical protein
MEFKKKNDDFVEKVSKHNRSLKFTVQGLDFMAHPLYI